VTSFRGLEACNLVTATIGSLNDTFNSSDTNVVELRNIRKYLYKIRCKWENKICNTLLEDGKSVVEL
jgi:hypothetical protein